MTKIEPLSVTGNFDPLPIFGHTIQQAILPIIALADEKIIFLGTGFIIHQNGLMMTAKHLFDDVDIEKVRLRRRAESGHFKNFSLYALYVSSEKHDGTNHFGGLWPIEKVWFNKSTDLAFCWLKKALIMDKPFQFPFALRLSFQIPTIGSKTLAFGYYSSNGKITNEFIDGKQVMDYSQNTAFSKGTIIELYGEKRDNFSLNYPSFQVDARIEPGMSGSPVFNEQGSVCGLVSRSLSIDSLGEYVSFVSLLWPSLGINVGIKIGNDDNNPNHLFHELIRARHIIPDGGIENIIIKKEPNGETSVIFVNLD